MIQHYFISANGEKLMRRALLYWGVGYILFAGSLAAQTHYFPAKTFGDDPQLDQFVSGWYSGQLTALKEPSLLELSKVLPTESYRFLWLRTFHHPVAIRVDVQADGSATLTTKIASGAGGYKPGNLVVNTTRALTKDETQKLIARINDSGFWQLPSYERNSGGTDGSEWIIEAAVHGQYHLVSEWTPRNGPIRDLGTMFLFDLAKIDIPKNEIY
jgi:hypothetical protein